MLPSRVLERMHAIVNKHCGHKKAQINPAINFVPFVANIGVDFGAARSTYQ